MAHTCSPGPVIQTLEGSKWGPGQNPHSAPEAGGPCHRAGARVLAACAWWASQCSTRMESGSLGLHGLKWQVAGVVVRCLSAHSPHLHTCSCCPQRVPASLCLAQAARVTGGSGQTLLWTTGAGPLRGVLLLLRPPCLQMTPSLCASPGLPGHPLWPLLPSCGIRVPSYDLIGPSSPHERPGLQTQPHCRESFSL